MVAAQTFARPVYQKDRASVVTTGWVDTGKPRLTRVAGVSMGGFNPSVMGDGKYERALTRGCSKPRRLLAQDRASVALNSAEP